MNAGSPFIIPRRRFYQALAAAVLLSGCVYVGLRWSPSSYAIVLEQLGVEDRGLVIGAPRPERGDEFGWHTPLLMMTIRSGFERYDRTPPYFEDLRTLYALPIVDWALIFKPQLWVFHVAPAPIAFSFYHFLMIAMFVVGFSLLFIQLGGRPIDSLLMALVLFFAAYTQYWWNGAANYFFPFFPWIVLALLWPIHLALRLLLFYYLLVSGLLTYFYPPNALVLGFVALVLLGVAQPGLFHWRRLVPLALTAAAAAGTAVFYLRDDLLTLAGTTYPGSRVSSGGGFNFARWLTQFLPTAQQRSHESLLGINICEASMLGSIYALAVLCFFPWSELAAPEARKAWRRWALLGGGLLATQLWMTVRLPPWVGYPLLWHRVPPGRMVLAGGLLLLTLVFLLAQSRPLRFTAARLLLFAGAILFAWCYYKWPKGIGFLESRKDWAILVPVLGITWLRARRVISAEGANTGLLGAAVLVAAVSFGTFNPIQSSEAIFQRHQTSLTKEFDRRLREERRGFLLLPWGTSFFAHTGLPLIGLGYPSLSYSTFDPAVDLWRRLYPELTTSELQVIFNNAGSFAFGDVTSPQRVPGTLVTMTPMAPLQAPRVTICDLIRPSRARFAATAGCPTKR